MSGLCQLTSAAVLPAMPAVSLFGRRVRNLASDNTAFYLPPAIVHVVWLFIYWIGIVAFSRPEACDPGTASGGQQWVAVFTLLALFIAQAALCCAAVLLSLRGWGGGGRGGGAEQSGCRPGPTAAVQLLGVCPALPSHHRQPTFRGGWASASAASWPLIMPGPPCLAQPACRHPS